MTRAKGPDMVKQRLERKLDQEYRHLQNKLIPLAAKYTVDSSEWADHIEPQVMQILQRQDQILRELEQLTGSRIRDYETCKDMLRELKQDIRQVEADMKVEAEDERKRWRKELDEWGKELEARLNAAEARKFLPKPDKFPEPDRSQKRIDHFVESKK
jgi:hypothetical protein